MLAHNPNNIVKFTTATPMVAIWHNKLNTIAILYLLTVYKGRWAIYTTTRSFPPMRTTKDKHNKKMRKKRHKKHHSATKKKIKQTLNFLLLRSPMT